MNQGERLEAIKHYLTEHDSIQIEKVCDMFQVSKDTARRDLVRLENNNQIIRTRGGAMRSPIVREIASYHERLKKLTDAHKQIGKMAAAEIEKDDRIILDASTTVQTCAIALSEKECTVVTNSIHQADVLAPFPSVTVHLVGGQLHKSHLYMYGVEACHSLSRFFVNKAFIGVVGISNNGITVAHDEDAAMKKQMIRQAEEVFVLADHTKFGKTDFVKIADFREIDCIITDQAVEAKLMHQLINQGVKVMVI
ncbi:DeoR family transcriptional regulator [Salipaludibacillus keqinensis]|uniref:DeoR family transcriptional regulator n=1 Tax=Salipaludibacillus keqinensis TaxID=2045207 RepID=A0A323TRH5_9BACI|nr:DeoR/GlpR family DNA-binding transcription regulator [Salipaludibacillus keqinensis]PYZ95143.1 DeoR family transcriptional regulator [Salipaludibacillus keqinensis]